MLELAYLYLINPAIKMIGVKKKKQTKVDHIYRRLGRKITHELEAILTCALQVKVDWY